MEFRLQKSWVKLVFGSWCDARCFYPKLAQWVQAVNIQGVEDVRKIPGYHDEILKGDRKGQRSIRLNRSYRAIYIIKANNSIEFISVEEVSKHDY